jgi:hypothetical protein
MDKKFITPIDIIFGLFYIINNWNIFSLSRDYFCGFIINPRGLGVGSVFVVHGSLFTNKLLAYKFLLFSLNNYLYGSLVSDKMSAE